MKPLLSLLLLALCGSASAQTAGDVAAGEKVFRKCKACHQVGPDASSKTGPTLNGILNAPLARDGDFPYSKAFQEAAADGMIWDEALLTAFLKKPTASIKGTKMTFRGLRKDSDIADVIAYLATFD